MPKQRITIITEAIVDTDKWSDPDQRKNESILAGYTITAIQDKINNIQGGDPIEYKGRSCDIKYVTILYENK